MVLSKNFSLFGLSVSRSKYGCLRGSNYLNLHWKLHFSKIYSMHNLKLFCPSDLTIVVFLVTLKQVNFFHVVFNDTTLKS